jgi:hypothetical protein
MKKFLAFASVLMMLFCVSCSKDDDNPTPPSPAPGKTYLQILREDVGTILNKYPEFKKESQYNYPFGYLRQIYYKLNGNISDTPLKDLKATIAQYGFDYTEITAQGEKQHILVATRNFDKGLDAEMTYQTAVAPGYPQDVDIIENLDKIITLEHALKNLKESNVTIPQSADIYLIKPAVPYAGADIIYLVNKIVNNTVVYVDAQTGEVKTGKAH